MLEPLFNCNCELVAWIDPGKNIFDTNMDWVAYISKENVWSSKTRRWLGPIKDLVCLDTRGKVFAWGKDSEIKGATHPLRPSTAIRPARPCRPPIPPKPTRPCRPVRPLGGWSNLSFEDWLNQ